MAGRCGVCGFESEGAVCPRCNTILLRGQAICARCGKLFPGWIAVCDACGASLGPEPSGPADAEAVRLLASVPGISEDQAKVLVSKGFRDFSDIVRLALPDAAVQKGLHHAIARRALLADLPARERRGTSTETCPVCAAPWPLGAERCPVCGSAATTDLPVASVERTLRQVADELVTLGDEEDVDDIPEDLRKELLGVFEALDPEEVVREEYRRQIEAWRAKGFAVGPLEDLLAKDLDGFRARGVRLIRAQMRKKVEGGTFRCPLCDVAMAPEAEACENCGAKFV